MFLLLALIIYPFYCWAFGSSVLNLAWIRSRHKLPARFPILIGLLLNNFILLALKNLGVSWLIATLIVWVIPGIYLAVKFWKVITWKVSFKNSFLYYAIFNLIIGISLFDLDHGIRTYWISNYGDLAYHFGMITSFVFGDNFPPEYHLYAGTRLTYPFMINFWTASFWWISPEWRSLEYIFLYQWCFLTTLLYGFLRGGKHKIFPWLVLLGGGVYGQFTVASSKLIEQGLPWTSFLETIWVPQRSTLFGAVCLIATLSTWLNMYKKKFINQQLLVFGALVVALMPLIHTHCWMIAFAASCLLFLLMIFQRSERLLFLKNNFEVILILCSSLVFLIYLSEKTSAVSLTWGWISVTSQNSPWILEQASFWLQNTWNIILIFIILIWKVESRSLILFIVFSFLFGNFVKLSFWNYDQIKIFIPIYLFILLCWQSYIKHSSKLNYCLILLIIPGVVRLGYLTFHANYSTPYTESQLVESQALRELIPVKAIVAANPLHNSTITLTGRKLYLGFLGTLWSHGVDYQARESMQKRLPSSSCNLSLCPDYIYQPAGDNYWGQQQFQTPLYANQGSGVFRSN